MATWADIRGELAGHGILIEAGRAVTIVWRGRLRVTVRAVRVGPIDWLLVTVPVAVQPNGLVELLRRSAARPIGAIVIEGDCCFLREKVELEALRVGEVATLIDLVARQLVELSPPGAPAQGAHPYAELFCA
jgi:hypothetical protein